MSRHWMPAEIELLRALYPDCHTDDVAALVGRTTKQCYQAAERHGLRKTAEYLASDAACRVRRGHENAAMIGSRFGPGQTPWNKGLRGVVGVQPECRATQFKPGNKPHQTLPIGSYRARRETSNGVLVLELKTSDTPGPNHRRWTPVSRIVWERENGPVPAGCFVVFKRGMQTCKLEEITPDRLECIDRAEHARRNHPRNKSPELARLVQLKGAITRQVNRISREASQGATP